MDTAYDVSMAWSMPEVIELLGRIVAFVFGIGTAIFATRLPRATKDKKLALRWKYTKRSPQVWLRIHELGMRVLYGAGALMAGAAFLWSGILALATAALILLLALSGLYFYAKFLYEDEFRR